ncbi:hypothetical protein SAMN06265338_103201 [Rhodoblastus acidophilus]|uniref:Uncharacterized protein n=1 Tax=Rhodoblastus acidophilus TaxID=1074 RepID=A0A212RB90_RHOAC|nr:hypothetical protein [Rhodoblastus acidophilus]PPQ39358.1 hypothetical protein CKO16_06280 [Rhodoblastus acidophilus]RAI22430.1 hypothetical protein CH337_05475 [Rhodoblastus acidophilus]SNB69335.1 hypothetical protein SAMN06265338_103201 [Rhodoblastus acidophilus]
MDIEGLRAKAAAVVAKAAYHSAGNFVAIYHDATEDSLAWPTCGTGSLTADARDAAQEKLAGFVRANPNAPAEALYRYAHGQEVHSADVDGFAECPLAYRTGYCAFATLILLGDGLIAQDIARLEAWEQSKTVIPAAALAEKEEDTILELVPDPLAKRDDVQLVQVETPAASPSAGPTDGQSAAGAAAPASDAAPIGDTAAPAAPQEPASAPASDPSKAT